MSDVQAAVLVQSAYRGFEVRKLEPLKKLKQMAEVRQQVAEIRNRIQALESYSDLQKNDKERVVIGEMIMRLLLKLDSIQVCVHLILTVIFVKKLIFFYCDLCIIELLDIFVSREF